MAYPEHRKFPASEKPKYYHLHSRRRVYYRFPASICPYYILENRTDLPFPRRADQPDQRRGADQSPIN